MVDYHQLLLRTLLYMTAWSLTPPAGYSLTRSETAFWSSSDEPWGEDVGSQFFTIVYEHRSGTIFSVIPRKVVDS